MAASQPVERAEIDELLEHQEWIHGIARALLAGPGADDVTQNLWLECIRRPFRPTEPRAWLRAVAVNLARKEQRTVRRRSKREELAATLPDYGGEGRDDPSAEQLLGRAQIWRSLTRMLHRLDEQHREPIVLRYFHDLSSAEIGQALGIPAGTVRRRLKEGLDKLRAELDERHGGRARWAVLLLPPGAGAEVASGAWQTPTPTPVSPVSPARSLLPRALLVVVVAAAGATMTGLAISRVTSDRSPAAGPGGTSTGGLMPGPRPPALVAPSINEGPAPAASTEQRTDASPGSDQGSLFAYWSLDEGPGSPVAADRSGNGNHCRLRDADPPAAWTDGKTGGALAARARGWLACERGSLRLRDELTVSAWIRPRSAWGTQTIVTLERRKPRGNDVFILALTHDRLRFASRSLGKNVTQSLPPGSFDGRWVHVAVSRRADGTIIYYANGVVIGQTVGRPFTFDDDGAFLTIGAGNSGPERLPANEHFAGDLDDVAIFSRALAAAEIEALAGGARPTAGRID